MASTSPTALKTKNADKDTSVDDLTNQIAVLKKDITELTGIVSSFGKERASDLRSTAEAKASEITTATRVKALETQENAEEFIRTQPMTALGIAAGVGFLIGMITTRR